MDKHYYFVLNKENGKNTADWRNPKKEYSFFHIMMIYAAIVAGGIAPILVISKVFLFGFKESFEDGGVLFAIVFAEIHLVLSLLIRYLRKLTGHEKRKNGDLSLFMKEHPNTVLVAAVAFVAIFFAMLTSDINMFFTFLFFIYGLYAVIRLAVASC